MMCRRRSRTRSWPPILAPSSLPDLAVDLDETDVELDLLGGRDVDRIDHLLLAGEVASRSWCLVGRDLVVGGARQHDAAVGRADLDVLAAGTLLRMVDARRSVSSVTSMSMVPTSCLFSSNKRDARGAEIVAQHVEGVVRQRIDVGDFRIADDDLVERHVGLDRPRLALGDPDRRVLGRGDVDHVAAIGRSARRRGQHSARARPQPQAATSPADCKRSPSGLPSPKQITVVPVPDVPPVSVSSVPQPGFQFNVSPPPCRALQASRPDTIAAAGRASRSRS